MNAHPAYFKEVKDVSGFRSIVYMMNLAAFEIDKRLPSPQSLPRAVQHSKFGTFDIDFYEVHWHFRRQHTVELSHVNLNRLRSSLFRVWLEF